MNNKHAYLIIAHNQFDLLEKEIKLIDDERNDIYLHIDKKVKDFDFEHFKNIVKKSNIYFTERTDVRWGDYSQINSEYVLLKCACSNYNYQYYHLLSGCDLPIKTQDYIHEFFDKINGKEIIQITTEDFMKERKAYYRISRYHFFTRQYKNNNKLFKLFNKIFNFIVMPSQRILRVDRLHGKIKVGYGANWFSITDSLARYVISKEDWVKKHFSHSKCADELFLQTIVINSKYYKNVYKKGSKTFDGDSCMRYIDWNRGNPYVFRTKDYKSLMDSKMLFARKFDINVDKNIVDMIYKKINRR